MTYYFSASTGGFYCKDIHDTIPEDAIIVDDGDYATLLEFQSLGQEIKADGKGHPLLVDPAPPSPQTLKANRVQELRRLLASTDYQCLADYQATKTPEDIASKMALRQAWREELIAESTEEMPVTS
jgi:hypothetical protein